MSITYQHQKVNNLIFDLGNVIIDISIPGTIARLADRSGLAPGHVAEIATQSEIFLKYEKGMCTDQEFHSGANALLGTNMSFEEFSGIWNDMLIRIPYERIQLLDKLKDNHRMFLLSNTNDLHLSRFSEMMYEISPQRTLDSYFEKAYYSHQIGMRKPDPAIFEYVLKENGLKSEETLFLDDNPDNVSSAASLGIKTLLVENPSILFDVFR
ncbi:MAG: HAD family hydrolase [Cyclobacteriaceae bacterium]